MPVVDGDPGGLAPAAVTVPVRLRVPSLAIDAPVDTVGLDADGAMELPEQVDRVGWYRYGASPASTQGATVIAGHVDDAVQGEGAMFDLREAEVGDPVQLTAEDGTVLTYRVASREEFDKRGVPLDALFSSTGPARLVLITCGGEFDRAARSYEDNIVVTALPG
ncbi:class F sortase [Jatrophihabitans sp. YIM 134969]